MMPIRVQRKRVRGWKMPENTVYVGRPSLFSNPWKIWKAYGSWYVGNERDMYYGPFDEEYAYFKACELYLDFILHPKKGIHKNFDRLPITFADIKKLRGKNLACFCSSNKCCHADILLKLANP